MATATIDGIETRFDVIGSGPTAPDRTREGNNERAPLS